MEYVKILDRYTRTEWWRKIGDEPWQKMDLSVFNGIVPVVFLSNNPNIEITQETLADPRTIKGCLTSPKDSEPSA